MKRLVLKSGMVALAVMAAAVFAVGFNARGADAQTPFVNAGGPYSGVVGTPIQFTSASQIGPVTGAFWQFGDGTTASGMTVVKTFDTAGVYNASVTITNIFGQSFTAHTTASIAGINPFPIVNTVTVIGGTSTATSRLEHFVPVTTVTVPTAHCGLVTTVGGALVSTCGTTTSLQQRVAFYNPACYNLWVQTGVMPACALAYR